MQWKRIHPRATMDMLGYIPGFLHEADPRPAKAQIDHAYRHGGGWNSFPGFTMTAKGDLAYPGDPLTHALYETRLRDEVIRYYEHSWVAIIQPDGSFDVARLD